MDTPDIPSNEQRRLSSLNEYAILDTLEEQEYDDITFLAATLCQTPMALITLVDEKRQWFKSKQGIEIRETPRQFSLCAHAINHTEPLVVNDARLDKRFSDNPFVSGPPNLVFYAGIPLFNEEGLCMGTLCVMDKIPRELSEDQLKGLQALARQVMTLFDLRKKNILLDIMKMEVEMRTTEMERFARVVAHDLKSPLNSITGLTDLLLNHYSHLQADVVEIFDHINKSTQRLKLLINDILKKSILADTQKDLVPLKPFAEDIVRLLKVPDSEFRLNGFEASVILNKVSLQQILINLIGNAIKYNFSAKVIIELTYSDDELFYYFSVKDNGIGVPKEKQSTIFELFNKSDSQDRYNQSGTGVGLHSVKKMVEEQGGEIWVNSEEGKGSEFCFTIRK